MWFPTNWWSWGGEEEEDWFWDMWDKWYLISGSGWWQFIYLLFEEEEDGGGERKEVGEIIKLGLGEGDGEDELIYRLLSLEEELEEEEQEGCCFKHEGGDVEEEETEEETEEVLSLLLLANIWDLSEIYKKKNFKKIKSWLRKY